MKKTLSFQGKKAIFCSKYEVLSLSKRRFLEIRRRLKMPKRRFIFVNLKRILQTTKNQHIDKLSNTRKNSA